MLFRKCDKYSEIRKDLSGPELRIQQDKPICDVNGGDANAGRSRPSRFCRGALGALLALGALERAILRSSVPGAGGARIEWRTGDVQQHTLELR